MSLLGYFSYMLISTVNRTTYTVSNYVEKSNVGFADWDGSGLFESLEPEDQRPMDKAKKPVTIRLTQDSFDIGLNVLYTGPLPGI